MMKFRKSCRNCSHKFDDSCPVTDMFDFHIEDQAYSELESGVFEGYIQEELDLKEVFKSMQEKGFIRKNANLDRLADDDFIRQLFIEAISECVAPFVINSIKNIKPKATHNYSMNFYCSMWR